MRSVEHVAYVEMTNTEDSVLHAVHRLYQGTLHFQNVIQFQSTAMNII